MSISVIYKLRTGRKLSVDAVTEALRDVRLHLGFSQCDVGLWVTSMSVMATYNRELRGKKGPTDVISLPSLDFERPRLPTKEFLNMPDLGDMLLCLPYVEKQAEREGFDLNERVQVLLVHSMLHLAGFDHDKDEDWHVMQKEEDFLKDVLGKRSYFLN